ncbi:MAG: hypothetical protein NXI19_11755 [Alphaproteobacteria bacterium]|nr:hypothetical protein [Alphaproteobacteria bacterium]
MDDQVTGRAMTEIGLALAMVFFCRLVLTLMSMGQGRAPTEESGAAFPSLRLSAPGHDSDLPVMTADDRLVLVGDGRYFDLGRRPFNPSTIEPGVRLTALDAAWRARIRQLSLKSPFSKSPEIVR